MSGTPFDWLVAHGWNATSFQTLEPGLSYFHDDRGYVAYIDTGGAWVAAGAPVAAADDVPRVTERFLRAATGAGRRARFFGVEERFLGLCPGLHAAPIGLQPTWNPTRWTEELAVAPGLREQLRRARAKGVRVRPVPPREVVGKLAEPVRRLVDRWQRAKPLPPMGFLVELELHERIAERRFFVAERSGMIVGLLALVPIYARGGWLLEDLLRDPEAPNGTTELLLDAAMRDLAARGESFATLGLAPLAGEVSGWLALVGRLGRGLFDFAGLHAFKRRLRPQAWTPIYLAYPSGEREFRPVFDSLIAFTRGRPVAYVARTIRRAPAPLLGALWASLVPWTIALAFAPPRWFPHPAVRWSWVAFDAAMALGLRSLARRWRPELASLLAGAATADALGTALQFVLFDASRIRGPTDGIVAAAALLAPAFATFVLRSSLAERAPAGSPASAHPFQTTTTGDAMKAGKPEPENPSRLIDARIAELDDWRGETLARVRQLIRQADPDVVEEWKWRGVPVWSHQGILCTGETYKSAVKLTFAKGAQLRDPKRLFNAGLEGNARRAIDLHEGDRLDEKAFQALVREAVALNES